VIALLMAAGTAFALCVFGTPVLIRSLRKRGIGQQIRDDGPIEHPHAAKAGTPTMGGIAIVAAALVGYLVAHIRTEQVKFARTGVTLMFLIVGMTIVGFVDEHREQFGVEFICKHLSVRKRPDGIKTTIRTRPLCRVPGPAPSRTGRLTRGERTSSMAKPQRSVCAGHTTRADRHLGAAGGDEPRAGACLGSHVSQGRIAARTTPTSSVAEARLAVGPDNASAR